MNPEEFIAESLQGLEAQTGAHVATWHFGEEDEWFVDQDEGLLQFAFADGTVAEAPVQIVGTYNPDDGSFLWGWDHPSVASALQEHARLAREFGEEHQLANYTTRKVLCSEAEAWEFTAVAARLAEANGAYRGDAGGPLIFMTFGEVALYKDVAGG